MNQKLMRTKRGVSQNFQLMKIVANESIIMGQWEESLMVFINVSVNFYGAHKVI
jgi:hypothetical protein